MAWVNASFMTFVACVESKMFFRRAGAYFFKQKTCYVHCALPDTIVRGNHGVPFSASRKWPFDAALWRLSL